jgi:hypothetical protein
MVSGIPRFTNVPIVIGKRSRCEPEKTGWTQSSFLSSRRIVTRHCKVEPDLPDFVFIHKLANRVFLIGRVHALTVSGRWLFWTLRFFSETQESFRRGVVLPNPCVELRRRCALHVASHLPLCGMSKVPHLLSDCLQPVSQRLISCTRRRRRERVHPLLLLRRRNRA